MQSKLYRFEIVRALANAVFEATDPIDGSTVFIYEWTPPVLDRAASKQRLEEIGEELNCEVFTSDASLYIAAVSQELGNVALKTLRAKGLFAGTWLDATPTVPPPPVIASVPPPAAPPVSPRRTRWVLVVFSILVVSVIAFGGGLYIEKNAEESNYQSRAAANSESIASDRKQLQDQLNRQSDAAQAASSALSTYSGTQLLRLKNGCPVPIRAAVLYVDYSGQRLVKGWTQISAGETAVLTASPSPDFDVYVETLNEDMMWSDSSRSAINVTTDNFVYFNGAGLAGDSVRQVHPYNVHISRPGDVSVLDCEKK